MINYGKHFKEHEFACKCCGKSLMQQSTLDLLNKAREEAGVPFVINSGYRCRKHNEEEGGKSNSGHMEGFAADINCTDSVTRYKLMKVLPKYFNRIGINKAFIHVDNSPALPQNVAFMY